jgi:hypothetical protein
MSDRVIAVVAALIQQYTDRRTCFTHTSGTQKEFFKSGQLPDSSNSLYFYGEAHNCFDGV